MSPTPTAVLVAAHTVLVVDWPSRDVPEALARAGYEVVVHGGPGPEDYAAWALVDGEVVVGPAGPAPKRADIVYSYRPLAELPEIARMAVALGANAVWIQSGLNADGGKDPTGCWLSDTDRAAARNTVETAGLAYVDGPYIVDVLEP